MIYTEKIFSRPPLKNWSRGANTSSSRRRLSKGGKFWKKRPSRKPKGMDQYLREMKRNTPQEESMALRLRDLMNDPVRTARAKLGLDEPFAPAPPVPTWLGGSLVSPI